MPDEKPFEATPSRLARARREGDVPRSQDVAAAGALAAGALGLSLALGLLASAASVAFRDAAARNVAWGPYLLLGAASLAVGAAASAGAVCATVLQAGLPAVKFPAPSLAKLDPAAGLRRMLSREALLAGAKACAAAGAVSCAVGACLGSAFATASGAEALAALVVRTAGESLGAALAVAASFAAGDVLLERAKWRRRLRMTFAELKRDLKQHEGDPAQRGKRRQAHRALARGSIARLKEAAFVVSNPTHVAIALEYRPPAVSVPRVLIRAIDEAAREVRRRARALGVPIVENAALARSLLAGANAGDDIPAGAYAAVAAIVASLLREGSLSS
jgi:flagellar biosynthetic protein FlhB